MMLAPYFGGATLIESRDRADALLEPRISKNAEYSDLFAGEFRPAGKSLLIERCPVSLRDSSALWLSARSSRTPVRLHLVLAIPALENTLRNENVILRAPFIAGLTIGGHDENAFNFLKDAPTPLV